VDALGTVEHLLREAVIDRRYETRGLDRKMLEAISNVPIQWAELGETQDQERMQDKSQQMARMMVPFAFMYLIFLGIVGMGQHMVSSIIEEKNSRIIEVLLSAVSPFELMAGKIAGLAAVGLTVMALYGVAGYAAARWKGLQIDIGAALLVYGLIYYILGFVLFSAILAGVGSVCNTIKETQSLMMPVMLVFIIPMIAWPRLAQEPNGELARVLSYVPPATPMVMVLRLSSGTAIWTGEVVLSLLVLMAGVLVAMWAAAKVFRTGILLYGKRPGPREILRWLREK
jgi:ABC-type Na+ efflux pump permease subunit